MTKEELEMLTSLAVSIDKVGGNPKRFLEEYSTMTVKELVESLAPNRVRFTVIDSSLLLGTTENTIRKVLPEEFI